VSLFPSNILTNLPIAGAFAAVTHGDAPRIVAELLIILAAGLAAGVVCKWLRTSVLVGYLVVGALLGLWVFNLIGGSRLEIELVAEAGVFLLLFSIGLEFSLEDLARLGRHLLIGGATQMLLVAAPVMAAACFFVVPWKAALLIGSAIAFSSTVLVFKALVESGQTNSPHGRRAVGILLFQDAALVPLLLVIPLLTGKGEVAGPVQYAALAGTSVGFVGAVIVLRRFLAKWFIPLLANYRSPELVVLLALVVLSGVTLGAYAIGLPPAVGAFAAGLVFSGNRWTAQVDALVLPFREAFAAVFFVSLGLLMDLTIVLTEPLLIFGSLAGIVAVKAAAAVVALRLTGLPWKAASGMSLGLAHVGEFAFVLIMLGLAAGVLTEPQHDRLLCVAIGSLILTPLFLRIGLRWTETEHAADERGQAIAGQEVSASQEAVVVGIGPVGRQVASQLEIAGQDVCLVDLSPVNLQQYAQQGFRTVAGDAVDRGVLLNAHADHARQVIVCVPNDEAAVQIARAVRAMNRSGYILVRCRYQSSRKTLLGAGADSVVSEEVQASDALIRILEDLASTRDADGGGAQR